MFNRIKLYYIRFGFQIDVQSGGVKRNCEHRDGLQSNHPVKANLIYIVYIIIIPPIFPVHHPEILLIPRQMVHKIY